MLISSDCSAFGIEVKRYFYFMTMVVVVVMVVVSNFPRGTMAVYPV